MRFSQNDKRKIERILFNRQRRTKDPNLLGVGFGYAYKNNKADDKRKVVVKYFVRKKLLRPSNAIPPEVSIRFKKGNKWVRATLKTDVEVQDPLEPTGAWIVDFPNEKVTTGLIVTWLAADGNLRCGIVTVGHGFLNSSDLLVTVKFPNGVDAIGFVLADSFRRHSEYKNRVDAALVIVREKEISNYLQSKGKTLIGSNTRFLTSNQIAKNQMGVTLSPRGHMPIRIKGIQHNPQKAPITGLPKMVNFVFASSTQTNTFVRGTSGSIWTIDGLPAVMQSGGSKGTWQLGGGQAVSEVIGWTRKILRTNSFKLRDYF